MQSIFSSIQSLNQFLWSGPLLFLLMGTHLYFTIKLKFPQKNILKAIRLSITPSGKKDAKNLSVFATLSTTLAATLGTGNIIGVSTAVALGGPGAIFWCWITGILGMATSYAECFLSVRFRSRLSDGTYQGGPMYVWENALHRPLTGKFYGLLTLLAAFGVGCTTQANSITQTTSLSFGLNPHIAGILAAFLAGLVIVGGIKSIGNVCMKIVPALAILYTASCILLLIINREAILPAIQLILSHALAPRAAIGGAAGSSLMLTARYGIARGLFTNEAGIGTAAITAAASVHDCCILGYGGYVPVKRPCDRYQCHAPPLFRNFRKRSRTYRCGFFLPSCVWKYVFILMPCGLCNYNSDRLVLSWRTGLFVCGKKQGDQPL